MRRALLALAVLLVMPLAAAAPGDDVGWSVQLASTTYFTGDWINVSVVGPRPPPVPFLYFNLTDPNGTILEHSYKQVINGSANFSFLLKLDAPTGRYILNCTANTSLIAQIALEVVYDELNYLSKRIALLERDLDKLELRVDTQRQEIRDAQAKVAWYWLIPIEVGIIFVVLGWWFLTVVLPTWRLVFEWYYPVKKRLKKRVRVITWFLGRYGQADQRAYYTHLRINRLPIETDPMYRAARRLKGLAQEDIPRSAQLPDPPAQKPVRPKRVKAKVGGRSS